MTLVETLLQIPLHSTYHRGQIAIRMRELGGEPAATDFILWVFIDKPAAELAGSRGALRGVGNNRQPFGLWAALRAVGRNGLSRCLALPYANEVSAISPYASAAGTSAFRRVSCIAHDTRICRSRAVPTASSAPITGDTNVSVFLFNGQPGSGPGPHRHPYDEIQFIQSGRGSWVVNGVEFEAGAGDVLVIKAGEIHSFRNTGDEPLVQLDVHLSPRFIQENL